MSTTFVLRIFGFLEDINLLFEGLGTMLRECYIYNLLRQHKEKGHHYLLNLNMKQAQIQTACVIVSIKITNHMILELENNFYRHYGH